MIESNAVVHEHFAFVYVDLAVLAARQFQFARNEDLVAAQNEFIHIAARQIIDGEPTRLHGVVARFGRNDLGQ